jgi:hypothetical protein
MPQHADGAEGALVLSAENIGSEDLDDEDGHGYSS